MVFPLVMLLAILPGLMALNAWDLTPPGPMWGLRGLAIVDGLVFDQLPAANLIKPTPEAAALRAVAYQPPLYAWLEALGFWLSGDRNPLLAVVPSYLAGALVVLLVYLHGRLWHGAGVGLTAAILVGFNQNLLLQMQEATPTTLALCGALAVLLCYGRYEHMSGEVANPWHWSGPFVWAVAGGMALGLALLALSWFALIVFPVILLHRYYLRATSVRSWQRPGARQWRLLQLEYTGLVDSSLALGVALLISLPWYSLIICSHGWAAVTALATPPDGLLADRQLSLLPRLIALAPAALPLGILGAVRVIRSALVAEANTHETAAGSLWVIWLVVAALVRAVWRSGPQTAFDLVLLVPVCLLAAQTIGDLVNRRLSVRALLGLAPATAISVSWWASADLSEAISDVLRRQANTATVLGLHLGLDLVVMSVWMSGVLNRWAHRRDDRQRWILASFLLFVLVLLIVGGLREVLFRHSETRDLLSLRTMILRRNRELPFSLVAVVTSPWLAGTGDSGGMTVNRPSAGGRLRFVLRTALPQVPQLDLRAVDELFSLPNGQRLIILVGSDESLSSADQHRLGVEAIHPGRFGILGAYATAYHRQPRR
jgi:4-amino-4-deoxy-L-arabinose transferase-like glycosyltransferase